ncbi:MAG: diacylglycerol kinase family lipid kinase [Bacteroidia bacterium]|nr:diacylglycerol kinase family lipid kinase [Bacteroidia bacterium]
MKKLRILINPIAGHGFAPRIAAKAEQSKLKESYELDVHTTRYPGHAAELAEEAVQLGYDAVIAAGGDGTVNETASKLVHTDTILGIIPAGSGNGLARHLGYSMQVNDIPDQLAGARIEKIDSLEINGRFAVNVSGFGFDGYVAWKFNKEGKRGLSNYTRIALGEYFRYPLIRFRLEIDGKNHEQEAHMLVIANASQFGNAAIIAPRASLHDGLTDLVLVKKPPLYRLPALFYRMFNGTLKDTDYLRTWPCKNLKAWADRPVHLHIDGEGLEPVRSINVDVKPSSLKVFHPQPKLFHGHHT